MSEQTAIDDDYEEECECIRIDVDMDDNRDCLLHGPNSEMAKRQRAQEAEDEAKFWHGIGEF